MNTKDKWHVLKAYIPGTWAWGARRSLLKIGQWPMSWLDRVLERLDIRKP